MDSETRPRLTLPDDEARCFFGAWSMPIQSADGTVLGTFGTYFREHRLPTEEERAGVAFLVAVASAAVEATAAAAG